MEFLVPLFILFIAAIAFVFYGIPSLAEPPNFPKKELQKQQEPQMDMLGLAAQIEKDLFFGTGKVSHSTDFPTLVKIKPIKLKKTKMTERKSKKKSKKKK